MKLNLNPQSFPPVMKRDMKKGLGWGSLWNDFRGRPKRALRVEAHLGKSYTPSEADGSLHFDGMLSYGMLRAVPWPLLPGGKADVIPLPLELAWVCPQGRPLWASTNMRPVGKKAVGVSYIHKRHPRDRLTLHRGGAVVTTAGSLKDVRIPQPVVSADRMEAWCIGCPDALKEILTSVTHVGKKSAVGRGRVIEWRVEPADVSLDWIMQRRPVPHAYCGKSGHAPPRRVSWTPPYWHVPAHMEGRPAQWMD